MSYVITFHSGGGSMAEGMQSLSIAVVGTYEEAEEVERWVYAQPYSDEYFVDIVELPETSETVEDAIEEIKKAYVFEEFEGEER